jgi:hypothetical protein
VARIASANSAPTLPPQVLERSGSHNLGKRPSGQSKTAIKAAAPTTKVSVTTVVVDRIGCLAKLKARLVTGLLFGERIAMQVRIRPADSR